ncbi:hypothetical protein N5947_04330 [Xanthomonas citri pv. punicae]|nr:MULTISPECIES: hypothetical protein [Xanthomonas]MBE0316976.1 hypothetical protein [Xanthomonas citri pv. punicae]MBV6777115.1 hypothetical protein [Xanthomonas campestris pv. carissae]MDS0759681.1 hypothetical protein [Xanthomonas citri pv. punicae]MDS0763457.1 hypothetical protein [Xanthomonas citri pv. punicae]MDS0798228.1 hypothetical protein [Xanthomonas citri pv. punicae]
MESARNGEIPKIQTPLFGTTRHPALSGLVVQTFPNWLIVKRLELLTKPLESCFHRGKIAGMQRRKEIPLRCGSALNH